MGVVEEGGHIPTAEEQQAEIDRKNSELAEERELHRKMRSSASPDFPGFARDKKEEESSTE